MDRPPPSVYLLHGDDDLAIAEFIARLKAKLGDPATAELNIQTFSADTLQMSALEEACTAAPFLSRRRLIIVTHASAFGPAGSHRQEALLDLLGRLPPTTALVLVEASNLESNSPLPRWAEAHQQAVFIREFAIPRGPAFVGWIRDRCKSLGGEVDPEAARLLADSIGEDPRLAHHELTKLLDYVDRSRPIRREDVEALTPVKGQSDVFAMADALGTGDGRQALAHLQRLLADESPRAIFPMIVRHFRLLLLAREALDSGQDPKQALSQHRCPVPRITTQARRFSAAQLHAIYHRLLETDVAMKTSQIEDAIALQTLVASLATQA